MICLQITTKPILQKLAAVTVEDVSRVAKKYITPSKARIVVVGNKDEVMSKLTAFDKEDGKIQLYDIYANPRKDESGAVVDISAIMTSWRNTSLL